MFHLRTKYINEEAIVEWSKYQNGTHAMVLRSRETYEPLMIPTINLEDMYDLPDKDHMYIKTYSENEGILDALVGAGLVEDTGKRVDVNEYGSTCALVRKC